ncbi:MAG: hypothetical protein Q8P18_18340 [Pseudomonadota bacterium]|nr:hypothetical protein [Pseudomonadota bacterium]
MADRPSLREQKERFVEHLVRHGERPERAREIARREATKQENGEGVRRPN